MFDLDIKEEQLKKQTGTVQKNAIQLLSINIKHNLALLKHNARNQG